MQELDEFPEYLSGIDSYKHTEDSFTVKTTEANISIQDLRTDKEDHTEHKVVVVERNKEGEPLMSMTLMPMDMSERPFYNEFEKMEKIEKWTKEIGNDQELGALVRKLCS